MDVLAIWLVAAIGSATLSGVFFKMRGGFGPFNLRVVGIVLIAVLSTLLGIAKSDNLNAAMGILGAIAGYLFGARSDSNAVMSNQSSIDTSSSNFGDNARIAGRDINETVNNINAKVQELGQLIAKESTKIDRLMATQTTQSIEQMDYLLNTIYERDLIGASRAIETVITRWKPDGWKLIGMTSDYQGMDGIFLLFQRPSETDTPTVQAYHGRASNHP